MSTRIANPAGIGQDPAQGHAAQTSDSRKGSWGGQTVSVQSKSCKVLGDAAEEITFEHSEKAEERKLDERAIEDHPPLLLPHVEKILEYLESVKHETPEKALQEFVDALKRHGHQDSPLSEARRRFNGTTEQFMALSYAAQELQRQSGYEQLAERVRDDLTGLMDDFADSIRADVNTIGIAAEYGAGNKEEIARLQAGYKDAVLGGESLAGILKGTIERFGDKDFAQGVSFLIRALGADIAAAGGPSQEPARLVAVLRDLHLLETLSTVLEGCQKLAAHMQTQYGVTSVDPGKLLQEFVKMASERWVSAERLSKIADGCGMKEATPKVHFLAETKQIITGMPLATFADPESRQNLLKASQDALDKAIELEEDEEYE